RGELREKVRPLEIDREQAVEAFFSRPCEVGSNRGRDARIVHERVKPSEGLNGAAEEGGAIGGDGDIAGDRNESLIRADSLGLAEGNSFECGVEIGRVVNSDVKTASAACLSDAAAEPAAGAGHQNGGRRVHRKHYIKCGAK